MKKILVVFVVMMFTINCFSQTKIIMEQRGGVYEVPCTVNGLPLKFIFDTGASDVSISLAEAVFMLKNGYLDKQDIGESVYYSIANGDVAKGTRLNIKEIEFAGLKLYNVEASIVHETSAPLLLGQSVISRLGKIQLDGRELTIMNGNNNSYNFSQNYIPSKKADNSLIQKGITFFENRNYSKANEVFSEYLKDDKTNTDVLYYRAKARRSLKNYYGAINDYYSVINLNSQYPIKLTSVNQIVKEKDEMLRECCQ